MLRNSSRIKYETIRNQTKREQLLGKAQSSNRAIQIKRYIIIVLGKARIRQRENIYQARTIERQVIKLSSNYISSLNLSSMTKQKAVIQRPSTLFKMAKRIEQVK